MIRLYGKSLFQRIGKLKAVSVLRAKVLNLFTNITVLRNMKYVCLDFKPTVLQYAWYYILPNCISWYDGPNFHGHYQNMCEGDWMSKKWCKIRGSLKALLQVDIFYMWVFEIAWCPPLSVRPSVNNLSSDWNHLTKSTETCLWCFSHKSLRNFSMN